jgi:RNA polymerase sigma factor (sigma-70 family)
VKPQSLFAAHRDSVYRYLSRIVGPDEAPDLTQEVFLRVTRSPIPDTSGDGERAWVFRIARNLAINFQRDRHRRPSTVELADTARPAGQETALAMQQALAQLAPVDRDVFLLREVVGLSYAEIGAACELTADAVRARLHRSRAQLRHLLSPLLRNGSTPFVRLYDSD